MLEYRETVARPPDKRLPWLHFSHGSPISRSISGLIVPARRQYLSAEYFINPNPLSHFQTIFVRIAIYIGSNT